MKNIVIAFEYVTGKHSAANIKAQFDLILERYGIKEKIFKVVADQAANMKKALEDVSESTSIPGGANEDNIMNLTKMLIERRRNLDAIEEKQQIMQAESLIKDIEEFNNEFQNENFRKYNLFNRDDILSDLDLDEMTEELSENSDDEEADKTFGDQEDIEEDEYQAVDPTMLNFVFSSYLPCAAHNGQLVLKDGINLNEEYTKLIKKISHDIVSKTKVSSLIAEEIRRLDKTLKNYVITRWNSILFMIRSVLKLTESDFKSIRNTMNTNTEKQRQIKKNFRLSEIERVMLIELENL